LRLVVCLTFLLSVSAFVGAETPAASDLPEIVQWYQQHYVFATNKDSIYTFKSEFEQPEGYFLPDSSHQSAFQNWVANFPLWHRWRGIGNWKGRKVKEAEEITRGVHLTWRGRRFRDCAIPVRILGEFAHYEKTYGTFAVTVKPGVELSYNDWLKSKLVYDARSKPIFQPSEERPHSEKDFYSFLAKCMENSTYASLAMNCDSLAVEDLLPGDLIIGHDSSGLTGETYVIMRTLVDRDGRKLFTVATGCADACDFHIPLLGNDRDKPYIDTDRLETLAADWPYRGYFRARQFSE